MVPSPNEILHFRVLIYTCLLFRRQFSGAPGVDPSAHPGGGSHDLRLRFEASVDGPDIGLYPA